VLSVEFLVLSLLLE